MFNTLMILLADAAQSTGQPPASPSQDGGGLLGGFLPVIAIGLPLFYFIVLRPMQRQDKEKAALLNQVKKNDKIITHAGIYGTVVSVSDTEDEITVKIDDNVRVKMVKNSIMRNLTNEEAAKEAKAAKDAAKKGDKASSASTAVTTKEGGA